MENKCHCCTKNNQPCNLPASRKAEDNPLFCWRHQNCLNQSCTVRREEKLKVFSGETEIFPIKKSRQKVEKKGKPSDIQIFESTTGKSLYVCGETRPYMDYFKGITGQWNENKRCWNIFIRHKDDLLKEFGMTDEQIRQTRE